MTTAMHAKICHLTFISFESSNCVLQLPIRKAKYEMTLKEPGLGDIIGCKLQVQAQVRPAPLASSPSFSSNVSPDAQICPTQCVVGSVTQPGPCACRPIWCPDALQLRGDVVDGTASVDGKALGAPVYYKGLAPHILPLLSCNSSSQHKDSM